MEANIVSPKSKRINRIIKVPEEEPDGRHYDVSLNFMKKD